MWDAKTLRQSRGAVVDCRIECADVVWERHDSETDSEGEKEGDARSEENADGEGEAVARFLRRGALRQREEIVAGWEWDDANAMHRIAGWEGYVSSLFFS
jgi:hypothetical protein